MELFSAAQSMKPPNPEVDRQMGRAGVAQPAVSRRGRGFVVCASRWLLLRGVKKHQTTVILDTSVSIRVPARTPLVSTCQHGPCAEVREATGLTFSRLHFGGFAPPRAWRVSAGRLGGGGIEVFST